MMVKMLQFMLFGSLRKQLIVGMALVVISTMTLFVWNTIGRQQDEENSSHSQQVTALANGAATSSAVWVASRDYSGLQEIVQGIARYPNLRYIMALDLRGQVLAHSDSSKIGLYLSDLAQWQKQTTLQRTVNWVEVVTPISLAGTHIGWIRIGMDRSHFNEELAKTRRDGLVFALIGIVLSILIAFVAARILTRRLAAIQKIAELVNAGNSTQRVALEGHDEAARLARQFNKMLDSLAQREAALKHSQLMMERTENKARIASFEWDVDRNMVTWSPEMFRIFGRDPAQGVPNLEGQAELYTPESSQKLYDAVNKAVSDATPYEFELMSVQPNGEQRPCFVMGFPERDSSGRVVRLTGLVQDITQRKLAETLLAKSEASLRVLIEHSPVAMLVDVGVDTDEHVEMLNQQFTTLFGYAINDVPNVQQWWLLAYPDEKYREEVRREWIARVEKAVASHGDIEPMETVVTCKDRTRRYVRVSLASIGSRNIVTFEDLTARKQAEDELRRYKDHLEEVVTERTAALADANQQLSQILLAMDRAGVGIHWIDGSGRFIYVNEYAAQLLGYTQAQMMEMNVADVDPDFAGKDFKLQSQSLRERGTATIETSQRHKNGDIIPLEVTFYYQPGKEENLGRFISFVTDIRQRKQAELELRRAMDSAEAANKAKSVFLASMSHELRTPLNAILGFSNLLRRDEQLRPEQRTNLDIINRSGEHLLTLINDILEMSKIEAGKTQLNLTVFDLGALVRDVTDMMELRARTKGLRLLLDQSSTFPRYIVADEARLRQILINLLGNAVKFTEHGGVTLRLGTKHNDGAHLIIEIEDSGSGISSGDQPHLFQPFMQFGKQAGDNKGTGLGLSITRQFVQLMGGSISVASTLGKGSLFRVELPLEEAKDANLPVQLQTEQGEVTGLAPGQRIYRILIVEDQLENQLLLTQLMQRIGFEVKVAPDGEQGVQLFQSWKPDLIFMDRRMPKMDGIEATKAIRQLPAGNEVKIVAVTASAFVEQRDEVMAVGVDDFVRKPYRFSEIYDSLGRQLGVQYSYAQGSSHAQPSEPVALSADMLAVLPQRLREELKAALESLDGERINRVVEQVKPLDRALYHSLFRLVDSFDYPSILNGLHAS